MSTPQSKTSDQLFSYFQGLCVVVFCLAAILTILQIKGHIPASDTTLTSWLQTLGAFLLAMTTADFASGLLHFTFDTFGDENTPFFGPHFIKPFREHHHDPREITRHAFLETNGLNFLAVAPLMSILYLWLMAQPDYKELSPFGSLYLWFFFMAIALTNQFHKWAHSNKRPAIITALQKIHLILPFNHHTVHHSYNHDKYYCITTGWLNPVLTKIGFFEAIQKCFTVKK